MSTALNDEVAQKILLKLGLSPDAPCTPEDVELIQVYCEQFVLVCDTKKRAGVAFGTGLAPLIAREALDTWKDRKTPATTEEKAQAAAAGASQRDPAQEAMEWFRARRKPKT